MKALFLAAAALAFGVGLVHSLLGERLIFSRLRGSGWVPNRGGGSLGSGHVRILWASWHVLTVFGWALAALLVWLWARWPQPGLEWLAHGVVVAMATGALLVLVGTRGRHPGWIGLLGVAALTLLAQRG